MTTNALGDDELAEALGRGGVAGHTVPLWVAVAVLGAALSFARVGSPW